MRKQPPSDGGCREYRIEEVFVSSCPCHAEQGCQGCHREGDNLLAHVTRSRDAGLLAKETTFLPMSRGAGMPGLPIAKETIFLPMSRGAGIPGLLTAKETLFLPMSRGAGIPGLLMAKEPLFPPMSRGAGMPGLPADTIALAKQGTVSAADKIRTENDFTKWASRGLSTRGVSPTQYEP